ncbi:hypothetical protein BOTBODRAFT_298186 [Botryobasidium botryosum FD-172 SS1]|uniref:Uncharacterized protein n=1 Tax=Botryobasidium botryosum (strain FD-172 SS1) TaxID=930990 RepID=A0A067MKV0_BOTB1|nr:hypothetical protein BOTBODRAFT_298186 [Botryobasidium botryosum FD-172 SS1]
MYHNINFFSDWDPQEDVGGLVHKLSVSVVKMFWGSFIQRFTPILPHWLAPCQVICTSQHLLLEFLLWLLSCSGMHMGRDLLHPRSRRSWSFISHQAGPMLSGLKLRKSLGLLLSTTLSGRLMGSSRLSWRIC